jgi:pseudouridine synthase
VRIAERNKSYTDVELTLVEGRNRQIRRMFAYLGYTVLRLVRLAIGGLQLGHVAPGSWRYLTSQEVADLLTQSTDANDA